MICPFSVPRSDVIIRGIGCGSACIRPVPALMVTLHSAGSSKLEALTTKSQVKRCRRTRLNHGAHNRFRRGSFVIPLRPLLAVVAIYVGSLFNPHGGVGACSLNPLAGDGHRLEPRVTAAELSKKASG